MLRSKLLAVAAVLAILACGACFLPPSPQPPPKIPPYLNGTRTLAMKVEDMSSADHFDPGTINAATADNFNRFWKDSQLRAEPWNSTSTADVVLHITVLSKSSSPGQRFKDKQFWIWTITADYTITAQDDGRLLWQLSQQKISFPFKLNAASAFPSWNSNEVINAAAYNLAIRSGNAILLNSSRPSRESP